MEKSQKELIGRTDKLEKGQEEFISGHKQLTIQMENVEKGQQEIKDIVKHTATLMTENFTTIKRDMRTLAFDVNSDVELLFKEMAKVKRKVNKQEH
ncbi:hypothetical protein [Neobacillus vireti]|uniref:hypothetical protein n=1 Tax=Neobacillus vireti TaxID=220686 RepID=UPI002FFFAD4B